jgi:hypothetical protein
LPVSVFQYIFFLNLEVIQLKLLKDLPHISLRAPIGIICVADADKVTSEEEKTNARKLLLVFC